MGRHSLQFSLEFLIAKLTVQKKPLSSFVNRYISWHSLPKVEEQIYLVGIRPTLERVLPPQREYFNGHLENERIYSILDAIARWK